MSAWRKVLLVSGIIGVMAVFLPLFELRAGPLAVQLSARQLSFGLDRTHQLLDEPSPLVKKWLPKLEQKVPTSMRGVANDAKGAIEDARTVVDAARGAALLFVPSALMLAISIAAFKRRRFGRALGAASLVCGLLSIAAFLALRAGLLYGLDEAGIKHVVVTIELGGQMLMFVGLAAVIAGVGGLVRPELPVSRPPVAPVAR